MRSATGQSQRISESYLILGDRLEDSNRGGVQAGDDSLDLIRHKGKYMPRAIRFRCRLRRMHSPSFFLPSSPLPVSCASLIVGSGSIEFFSGCVGQSTSSCIPTTSNVLNLNIRFNTHSPVRCSFPPVTPLPYYEYAIPPSAYNPATSYCQPGDGIPYSQPIS